MRCVNCHVRLRMLRPREVGVTTEHEIKGIHHITLVASRAEQTARFYVRTLGLGFVKKTVNFDAPTTYHLYFGDKTGTPGTLVTFFEWPDAPRGRIGVGTTHHFAMTVDTHEGLLKWKRRLTNLGVQVSGPYDRKFFTSIYFQDPDGVILEIATRGPGWSAMQNDHDVWVPPSDVQAPFRDEKAIAAMTWPEPVTTITQDMQLHGLHHVSAMSADIHRTDDFYGDILNMVLIRKSINYDEPEMPHWYWGVGEGLPGTIMTYFGMNYLKNGTRATHGHIGQGLTHHVAFEVSSEQGLEYWQERFRERGVQVTEILDRKYFKSIYFNDPDGHILEIATSGPGFLVDGREESLGKDLALPDWLEHERTTIEAGLSPINLTESSPSTVGG
jgi:glyoxalase family protein